MSFLKDINKLIGLFNVTKKVNSSKNTWTRYPENCNELLAGRSNEESLDRVVSTGWIEFSGPSVVNRKWPVDWLVTLLGPSY